MDMRKSFTACLIAVTALAFGECSLANADSFKVVTPRGDGQAQPNFGSGASVKVVTAPSRAKQATESAQTNAPSADEFNPAEIRPGQQSATAPTQSNSRLIELIPGHITEIKFDWDIKGVHVGDDKLIDVTPVDSRTLLIMAKHSGQKGGYETGTTNFYVIGDNDKTAVYDVIVDPLFGAKQVEIHNSKVLANSITYDCSRTGGCSYPVAHEVKKEDLPRGFQNISQSIDQNNTSQAIEQSAPQH
jgi:hypothetical protein